MNEDRNSDQDDLQESENSEGDDNLYRAAHKTLYDLHE